MVVITFLFALLAALFARADSEAQEMLSRYRDAVMQVRIVSLDRQRGALGTAFFTSPDGEVATNFHVFRFALEDRGASVEFILSNGKVLKKYLVGRCQGSDQVDICLLKLDYEPRKWFKPGWDLPNENQRVFLIGNPDAKPFRISSGRFLGTKLIGNAAEVEVSIPFEKGMSGGPIFTSDGSLVGMATRWITEWYGYEPTQRYRDLETSLGISTRELQKYRKKVTNFSKP